MSHYCLYVILPKKMQLEYTEKYIDLALAPYSENLVVEMHKEECWCNEERRPTHDVCKGLGWYWATTNPDAQWDWYRVGGRWDCYIQNKKAESKDKGFNFDDKHELVENNYAIGKDITTKPFAFLTPDGEWIERGKMGWWGIVTEENDAWEESVKIILKKYKEHLFISVDCHI